MPEAAVIETPVIPAVTPPVETPAVTPAVTSPAVTPAVTTPTATVEPVVPEGAKPQAPEKYELTLPEHSAYSADDVNALVAEAKTLGLTQAQAQTLLDSREAAHATYRTGLRASLEADKELGGTNLPQTQLLARAGRDAVFKPGSKGSDLIIDFLDRTGLGDHPDVVREFVRIGKLKAEDRPMSGDAFGATPRKSTAAVLFPSSAASA